MSRFFCILIAVYLWTGAASGATYEVKMLNRGPDGPLAFEPDYLAIQPGDTVIFRATDKSHNAASIDAMTPAGFPPFKGRIDEELHITFDRPGFYGVKCIPHYASGMVMLIRAGEAKLPDTYRRYRHPGLAQRRFDDIFKRVDAGQ